MKFGSNDRLVLCATLSSTACGIAVTTQGIVERLHPNSFRVGATAQFRCASLHGASATLGKALAVPLAHLLLWHLGRYSTTFSHPKSTSQCYLTHA